MQWRKVNKLFYLFSDVDKYCIQLKCIIILIKIVNKFILHAYSRILEHSCTKLGKGFNLFFISPLSRSTLHNLVKPKKKHLIQSNASRKAFKIFAVQKYWKKTKKRQKKIKNSRKTAREYHHYKILWLMRRTTVRHGSEKPWYELWVIEMTVKKLACF